MTETWTLPSLSRRAFWVVAVTAALTGLWFTAGTFAYTRLNHVAPHWPLVSGSLVLAGGLIGWSLFAGAETARSRLVHATIALAFSATTLIAVGLPVAAAISNQCGEGKGVSVLNPLGLLIPATYYAIGYYGFAHPRRLLYVWPLAVVAGLLVYLILDLVWKATSGCVPA